MVKKIGIVDVLIYTIVTLMAIACLIPIINTIAISVSDKTSATLGKVFFIPKGFNLSGYEEILNDKRFFSSFRVSVLRVVLGAGLSVIISILMAYPLSKTQSEFPLRKVYLWIMVFTMLFNGGLIPNFLLIKELGMLDTIWALVLPCSISVFNTFILMNFFKGIPHSLEEAALLDGASPLIILTKVYIPLAKASIATILLFSAVSHWNSFFDGKIYINTPAKQPLQTYIQSLSFQMSISTLQNIDPNELARKLEMSNLTFSAAKAIVSMIPIVAIYPFLQRFFVTGLVMGAVKE